MAKSLDTLVKRAVEEYVDDVAEKKINAFSEVDSSPQEIYQTPEEMLIDDLLSTIPRSEGYYIKLYKEVQSGKFEYKERIDEYEDWTDLESEIVNIVKTKTKQYGKVKWGSGKYKLMVFKEGERGFHKKPISFLIDADDTEFNPVNNNSNDFQYKLQEMGDFMKQIKEVTQTNNQQQSDPAVVSKIISDSFKQGIETVKAIMPQTSMQNNQLNPIEMSKAVMDSFKQGLDISKSQLQAPSQIDTMNMMLAMFKVLKETEKPKEDAFEMLLKLKQLGMISMPNENPPVTNDPINQVSKISELMQVMAPLMGNSPIEQPSAWMKLVEIVAPAIPQIIANVTSAVQSVTDLSKAKLSASLGAPLPQSAPSQIGIAGAPLPPNIQATQNLQTPQNEVKSMNPIVKQIYTAIKSRDIAFYPQMKSLIESWVNPYVITELREGRAQLDDFLSQAGIMLGEKWFTDEETKTYFEGFIAWCKEEHIKNIVVVKCDKCGDYFDVNKSDFKHGEKCDCGGILEAISNNGVTAPAEVAA